MDNEPRPQNQGQQTEDYEMLGTHHYATLNINRPDQNRAVQNVRDSDMYSDVMGSHTSSNGYEQPSRGRLSTDAVGFHCWVFSRSCGTTTMVLMRQMKIIRGQPPLESLMLSHTTEHHRQMNLQLLGILLLSTTIHHQKPRCHGLLYFAYPFLVFFVAMSICVKVLICFDAFAKLEIYASVAQFVSYSRFSVCDLVLPPVSCILVGMTSMSNCFYLMDQRRLD